MVGGMSVMVNVMLFSMSVMSPLTALSDLVSDISVVPSGVRLVSRIGMISVCVS